jgi:hypothetical protein
MKRVVAVILGLMMLIPMFTACSSNANGNDSSQNTSAIYETTIEEYYQAFMNGDIDTMLKFLDPTGPLYPTESSIQQLRDNPDANKVEGEVRVDSLTILSENASRAKVRVLLYLRVDLEGGVSYENSVNGTWEFSYRDGDWLIFNASGYE